MEQQKMPKSRDLSPAAAPPKENEAKNLNQRKGIVDIYTNP